MYKLKFLLIITVSFFIFKNLEVIQAQVLKFPHDEVAILKFLQFILEKNLNKNPKEEQLQVLDFFNSDENLMNYLPKAPSNMLIDFRYVEKIPNDKQHINFLEKEKDLLKKFTIPSEKYKDSKHSLFINTNFRNNGKESLLIKPLKEVQLIGRPMLAYIWVHSDNNPHYLILHFRNHLGVDISVSSEPLKWFGWKHLEIKFPYKNFYLSKLTKPNLKNYFTHFEIKSAFTPANSKKNNVSIMLHNFLILNDLKSRNYEGAEYEDDW